MLTPTDDKEARAIEFMRRFSELIMQAADGEMSKMEAEAAYFDIEQDTGMTREEAVSVLEVRLKPN